MVELARVAIFCDERLGVSVSGPRVHRNAEAVVVVIERRLATRVMKVRENFGNKTDSIMRLVKSESRELGLVRPRLGGLCVLGVAQPLRKFCP